MIVITIVFLMVNSTNLSGVAKAGDSTSNGQNDVLNVTAGGLETYGKYWPAIIIDIYPTEDGGELLYLASGYPFAFENETITPAGDAGEFFVTKIGPGGNSEWITSLGVTLNYSDGDRISWFFGIGGFVTHPIHGIVVSGSDYTRDYVSRGGSHIAMLGWDGELKWTMEQDTGHRPVIVDFTSDHITVLSKQGLLTEPDWYPPFMDENPFINTDNHFRSSKIIRYSLSGELLANFTFAQSQGQSKLNSIVEPLVFPFKDGEYILNIRDCWMLVDHCLISDAENDGLPPLLLSNRTEYIRIKFHQQGDMQFYQYNITSCNYSIDNRSLNCSDYVFGNNFEIMVGRPGYDGQSEFVRRELSDHWFDGYHVAYDATELVVDSIYLGNVSDPFDILVAVSCNNVYVQCKDSRQVDHFNGFSFRPNYTTIGYFLDGNFIPIMSYGYPKESIGALTGVFSIEKINSTKFLIHGVHTGMNLSILNEEWSPEDGFPARSFRFHVDFGPIVYEVNETVTSIIPDNNTEIPIIEPEPEIPCEEWTNESNCAVQEPTVESDLEEEVESNLSLTKETGQKNVSEAIPLVVVAGAGFLGLAVITSRKKELFSGLFGGSLIGVIGSKARKYTPSVRTSIIDLITFEPGIHQSEICRRLHLSSSQIQHHTEILIEEGSINRQKSGRLVTYYPICFDVELNEDMVLMPSAKVNNLETREKLILLLRESKYNGGTSQRSLAAKLECSQPNVHKHLKRLMDEGIIQKIEKSWRLTEIGEGIADEIEDEHNLSDGIFSSSEIIS